MLHFPEQAAAIITKLYPEVNFASKPEIITGGQSYLLPMTFEGKPALLKIPLYLFPTEDGAELSHACLTNEIWAYQQLSGLPGLVATYFSGEMIIEDQTLPYLGMRRYDKTLDECSHELALATILDDVISLALIVKGIHSHKLVHRDINPTNCFLDGNNLVLGDLGLVKEHNLYNKVEIVGTDIYAPPEQFIGKPLISTDVWSLGMTYFGLLTGEKKEDVQAIFIENNLYNYIGSKSLISLFGETEYLEMVRNRFPWSKPALIVAGESIRLFNQIFTNWENRIELPIFISRLYELSTLLS